MHVIRELGTSNIVAVIEKYFTMYASGIFTLQRHHAVHKISVDIRDSTRTETSELELIPTIFIASNHN